jgi:rhodanese-related sulfurtransferase
LRAKCNEAWQSCDENEYKTASFLAVTETIQSFFSVLSTFSIYSFMSKLLLIAPAILLLSLASCTNNQVPWAGVQNPPSPLSQGGIETAQAFNPQSTLLYVDVREDDEWAAGHIDGAIHVKLSDIEAGQVDAIPKDRDIALYCRSGRRSAIAMTALKNLGYTRVIDVGGMTSVQGVTIVR